VSLNLVFLLHALSSFAFVPLLWLFPGWLTDQLTGGAPLKEAGVVYARLYGLGVLLIGMLPWRARGFIDPDVRRAVALLLLVVELAGIGLCFTFPTGLGWAVAFWVSLSFYAFFAAAYVWVLFVSSASP